MRKGISPLVASVLLIAITIAIAAVLANWVSTYTQEALPTTSCIGGNIGVVSADYPYWDDTNNQIVAVIEATSVALTDFKFTVLMTNDDVVTYLDDEELYLEPGTIGTIRTVDLGTSLDPDEVWAVQILTSCPDVKSGWYELIIPSLVP